MNSFVTNIPFSSSTCGLAIGCCGGLTFKLSVIKSLLIGLLSRIRCLAQFKQGISDGIQLTNRDAPLLSISLLDRFHFFRLLQR